MAGRIIAGQQRFPDDDGSADPRAAAALSAYAAGQGSEHAALTALARTRLLVPVVAVLTSPEEASTPATPRDTPPPGLSTGEPSPGEPKGAAPSGPGSEEPPRQAEGRGGDWTGDWIEERRAPLPGEPKGAAATGLRSGERSEERRGKEPRHSARRRAGQQSEPDKHSEMALPLLVGNDGRKAVLAFTSMAALARWRPDARPVPVPAAQVWQAGLEEASAVVVDVAGPVPLAVEGARLAALAEGRPVPELQADPDLLAAVSAAVAGEPLLTGASLAACGDGNDLALELRLAAGCGPADPAARAAVQRAAAGLAAAAGGRLRRGLEVTVVGGSAA